MNKIDRETIAALAGRDDLTTDELIALAQAREGERPHREVIAGDGWEVELTRHDATHGMWHAVAGPLPNPYWTEIGIAGPVSEAVAREVAGVFLATPGGRREKCLAAAARRRELTGG